MKKTNMMLFFILILENHLSLHISMAIKQKENNNSALFKGDVIVSCNDKLNILCKI